MGELQFQIREATDDDIPALSDLMNHLGYPTSYEEMLIRYSSISSHPDYKTFVACWGEL